jgi:hypothetical protein
MVSIYRIIADSDGANFRFYLQGGQLEGLVHDIPHLKSRKMTIYSSVQFGALLLFFCDFGLF